MSDTSEWANVGVTLVGVAASGYFAWDARRQARQARHDADEAIAVQLRDEQRRLANDDVQREADAVLASTKTGWRRKWDECWHLATNVDRPPLDQLKHFAIRRLSDGVIIKREQPAREDVAVRLANHDSVTRAHAQQDGYRVVLKFDPDDPGRVL